MPKISVVLGSYNRLPYLKRTIASIRASDFSPEDYEMIVVDGGSTDGTMAWLTKQRDVITIIQHNRGTWLGRQIKRRSWGYFMNLAFKAAQGELVLMLSDDCLIHPGAMREGYQFYTDLSAAGKKVGAIPFYWRNWPEMEKYWVGRVLGGHFNVNHGMYTKKALEDVGYAEENELFFYYADGDLSLKIVSAGYEIFPCTSALVEHFNFANMDVRATNSSSAERDHSRYLERWSGKYYFGPQDQIGEWEYLPADLDPKSSLAADNWQWRLIVEHLHKIPTRMAQLFRKWLNS